MVGGVFVFLMDGVFCGLVVVWLCIVLVLMCSCILLLIIDG